MLFGELQDIVGNQLVIVAVNDASFVSSNNPKPEGNQVINSAAILVDVGCMSFEIVDWSEGDVLVGVAPKQ